MNDTLGQLTLAFPNQLPLDQPVSLLLHFNYTLQQKLSGFYRSHYSGEHTRAADNQPPSVLLSTSCLFASAAAGISIVRLEFRAVMLLEIGHLFRSPQKGSHA